LSLKNMKAMLAAEDELKKATAVLDKSIGLDRARALDRLITAQEMLCQYRHLENGNKEVAEYCQEILALDPNDKTGLKTKIETRLHLIEASSLFASGKYAEAKAAFERYLRCPSLTAEQIQHAYYAQGVCWTMLKQPEKGLVFYKKALDAAPQSDNALLYKALIAETEKKWKSGKTGTQTAQKSP
jgi:tetratricopeptide (TPR) repeat protein